MFEKIFDCVKWNLLSMRKNSRFIMALAMSFLICFFLCQRTIYLSELFYTKIQIFEAFIWNFSDTEAVLFSSFALILPMTQLPKLNVAETYLIHKKGKFNWLTAQFICSFIISFSFIFILLVTSSLMSISNAIFTNQWSDTAVAMSLNPYVFENTLTVVRNTIKTSDPYTCVIQIFFLLSFYMFMLCSLNVFLSLKFGKKTAVTTIILISFLCYLNDPEYFYVLFNITEEQMKYIGNLMSAWTSPLSHASYTMHTTGYNDLPTILQSILIFTATSIVFACLSFWTIKNQDLDFK